MLPNKFLLKGIVLTVVISLLPVVSVLPSFDYSDISLQAAEKDQKKKEEKKES